MLTELDKRVEGARFDFSIPTATDAQVAAALESLERAAGALQAELESLDWRTRHILDVKIAEHLSDLEARSARGGFRRRLTDESMALSVLINSMLRQSPRPKAKRGAPPKKLNNRVAEIVRDVMVTHGQEPMVEGGSAALATTATLRELGILAAQTARHPLRRAKTTR